VKPPAAQRSAFMLGEMLTVLVIGIIVGGVMAKLVIDAIYLQRVAGQRLDRAAVRAALSARLRQDAAVATAYSWDGRSLRLTNSAGGSIVDYEIADDEITRRSEGAQTHGWRATRLRFAADLKRGQRRDLFCLACDDQPPPRAIGLPQRAFTFTFVMPPAAGGVSAPLSSAPSAAEASGGLP
jgi:hypothetical protein